MGLNESAMKDLIVSWGDKPFRAKQLYKWVHQQGETDFQAMSDLAKVFRAKLSEHCVIEDLPVMFEKYSSDGTRKWLFDVGDNNGIETVFIPEEDRGTLCVSSQAGCNVSCTFCSTGYQGFNRNLTTAEIVGQLWHARDVLSRYPDTARIDGGVLLPDQKAVSNVVMMGMGEPLLNYRALVPALDIMLSDHGYGLSRRRLTVSTSGVVPKIEALAHDCPVALAVSLHASNDALRDQLIPLNKKYPLKQLIDACNFYLGYAPRDFITFEYIMIDQVNDLPKHADELIEISRQINCKFNLIPFNPFPGSPLKRSSHQRVREFADHLRQAGVVTTVRKTRGDDIDAACGQLAGEVKDRTRIKEKMAEKLVIPIQPV